MISYLFLIVEEVLTHIIRKACANGRLREVTMRGGTKQHTILQYTHGSSFMGRGDKQCVDELVKFLKLFNKASWMEIN